MKSQLLASASLIALLGLTACKSSNNQTPSQAAALQPVTAVDLHNTVCPVSNEPIGNSPNVVVYNGKVYHTCCADCPTKFQQDPQKYADEVAADPSKYGVKSE